ncbi:hypothetical protein TGME49_229240 [Toxoplasma gondii ME49]|uniref:Toxoplasma gondii family A protein n=3 Tax=Toxoplasma gondii TaxID=5811 RepID=A0A125YVQ5_TOXGM|nr:hypothetical protein TGME49_229240 [Toxoplasma gondii ME49]EPT29108.1 hypothetical protein TGME49_229240 [Toxoplasma gondii ME49]ESS35521.1 putative toxoplasma gondii family A protein [Toxoplasma gondii VEG]KYF45890.1 putative toxoplasma gondii family A protein [Toxoplasma gondii ARI]CEL74691.1 TPA: hypothetical protein BN1205_026260 [Toxoplasma gondii VEG]|eukprot:XP_002367868.1 hypothetical protein TGME49_229240 [Toxoplasma gondii ME49]
MASPQLAPLGMAPSLLLIVVAVLGNLTCEANSAFQRDTEGGSTANAHFTVTIPQVGIAEDERHEVFLEATKKLKIIDKTRKAIIDPASFAEEAYSYSADTKKCNVTKKVPYSTMYPKVPAGYTYWSSQVARVRSVLDSTYTFTSPAAEHVEDRVSFCIILKVPEGNGTSVRSRTGLASFNKQMQSRKESSQVYEAENRSSVSSLLRKGRPSNDTQKQLQQASQNRKNLSTQIEMEDSLKTITVVVHSGSSARAVLSGTLMVVLGTAWLIH